VLSQRRQVQVHKSAPAGIDNLLIYGSLNNAVNSPDYTASSDKMINE
jgi:hypothetical protein